MASFVFNQGKLLFATAGINWGTTALKAMLLTGAPAPTAVYAGDIDDTYEVTGGGATNYTDGGAALTYAEITLPVAGTTITMDADDLTWAAINLGAEIIEGIAIYKDSGNIATSPLVAFIDINPITTNGGDLTIQWHTSGVITLT